MKRRSMLEKDPQRRGSLAISLVANAIFIALIGSITFSYPPSAFFKFGDRQQTERVVYVKPTPRPLAAAGAGNGVNPKEKPKKVAAPAPVLGPSVIPTTLPPVPPPTVAPGAVNGSTTGTGAGNGANGVGAATGVEPALPDSRLELRPNALRLPLTQAQKNDSAVKAIYMAYREAEIAAEENRGRNPRDWTFEKNGNKYGIDSQYVYLGRFKLPSAILAAIPFNYGGVDGSRIIQARNANWIQNDIYSHSQGLSEDDFRAAVKRIRERKEREKKDGDDKGKIAPIVP
jgi:hypothetical protein